MRLFGREQFIQKLWQILTEDSILLTAERRMGKTEHTDSICRRYSTESQRTPKPKKSGKTLFVEFQSTF